MVNGCLSVAYNYTLIMASQNICSWVLLLEQDNVLAQYSESLFVIILGMLDITNIRVYFVGRIEHGKIS
jgi:hypothetical protein